MWAVVRLAMVLDPWRKAHDAGGHPRHKRRSTYSEEIETMASKKAAEKTKAKPTAAAEAVEKTAPKGGKKAKQTPEARTIPLFTEPPAKAPPFVGVPKVSKGESEKADQLVAYGTVVAVPFGALRVDQNVREIQPSEEEKARLLESIREKGTIERMSAYRDKNAPDVYHVARGSQRHWALTKLAYPAGKDIEIDLVEAPKTDAEEVLLGLADNIARSEMAWPDVARSVGRAIGAIDKEGNLRTPAAQKEGVRAGKFRTHAEVAAQTGLHISTVDTYCRIASVPYATLVEIYNIPGSSSVAETFSKYSEAKRPEVLAYYKQHKHFPMDETPLPQRKPGGGRKPKPEAERVRGGVRVGAKATREPAHWDGGEKPPTKPPPASPPPQRPLFVDESGNEAAKTREGSPIHRPLIVEEQAPYQREEDDAIDIADHFGADVALVRLLDACTGRWTKATIVDWLAADDEAVAQAIDDFKAALATQRAFSETQ
jgi:hypothetical protein